MQSQHSVAGQENQDVAAFEVLDVRRVNNLGNVRVFVSLRIGVITIHDAKVVQQPGQRPWLAMPDRQ